MLASSQGIVPNLDVAVLLSICRGVRTAAGPGPFPSSITPSTCKNTYVAVSLYKMGFLAVTGPFHWCLYSLQ